MSAYSISTYSNERQMIIWVHSGFSGYIHIWLETKIVFENILKIKSSADGEGYEINNEWHTEQAGPKFQGVVQ